jgi:outer membrane lipoprotein carrier protein
MSGLRARRSGSLLLVSALLCACLHAQPHPLSARELAQRVDRHYDSLRSLKAGFSESYAGLGIERTESGTLLLSKPGRMRWDYSSPPGKLFLLDGKYAWFYTPGDRQAQRIPAKELDDLRSPLRFLLGHTDLEKELTGLQFADGPKGTGEAVLIGQPKGQEKRVSRVALTIAPETGAIVAIEVDEADGATTRFTFTDQQPDAPVLPATFRFTPPAGVGVVDALPPV